MARVLNVTNNQTDRQTNRHTENSCYDHAPWAGTEGSMVSSLNCDHWLILDLEALSHQSGLLEALITDDVPLHGLVGH